MLYNANSAEYLLNVTCLEGHTTWNVGAMLEYQARAIMVLYTHPVKSSSKCSINRAESLIITDPVLISSIYIYPQIVSSDSVVIGNQSLPCYTY